MLDFFVSKLPQRLFRVVTTVILAVFLLVHATEIADYNKTARFDFEIATMLKKEYEKTGDPNLLLKGDLPEYLPQNKIYHDHIITGVAIDWGYTGMVRGLTQNPDIKVQFQKAEQRQVQ